MTPLKNTVLYSLVAGGGSIAAVALVPPFWQTIAVISVMAFSILLLVHELITDDDESTFRLQLSPTRRPKGSSTDVESNAHSVYYYVGGVLVFGSLTLLFVF